jgi:hypothetical protein
VKNGNPFRAAAETAHEFFQDDGRAGSPFPRDGECAARDEWTHHVDHLDAGRCEGARRERGRCEELHDAIERLATHGRRDLTSGTHHRHAGGQLRDGRRGDATHDAVPEALDDLERDGSLPRLVAHRELGEDIGKRRRVEADFDDVLARPDNPSDARGEVVRQLMSAEGVLHGGDHPSLELGTRGVQAVVHRRHRQPQERGDILLGTVVDVEQHNNLA